MCCALLLQPNDGYKWTSRYLQSNVHMQQIVETLLELAYVAPHSSLHAGKSVISITSECNHDRVSSLLGAAGLESGRFRQQVRSQPGLLYRYLVDAITISPPGDAARSWVFCTRAFTDAAVRGGRTLYDGIVTNQVRSDLPERHPVNFKWHVLEASGTYVDVTKAALQDNGMCCSHDLQEDQ